jgi:uncharacterized protein YndB with AHSA1/START domain
MQTTLRTEASVTIDAPPEKVWDAITDPDVIEQWFFGVKTESDWVEGSGIVHRGEFQGRPYEDRGTILAIDPPRELTHTHWSSMSGQPDKPENYEVVTWTLKPRRGTTELTVTEVNLPSEQAKAASEEGWKSSLASLKKLLETLHG